MLRSAYSRRFLLTLATLLGSKVAATASPLLAQESARSGNQRLSPEGSEKAQSFQAKSKFWTPERRIEYSKRRLDPNTWNGELFEHDLALRAKNDWPTEPSLSNIPSPAPAYPNSFGGALMTPKFELGNRRIAGAMIGWGKSEVNGHLFKNEKDSLLFYFNIFVLTDLLEIENGQKTIVSRNWPHILSTGKQKTSIGEVDWVHVGFANDDNYAFINQRIFDLRFGNTVLVAPQKGGSLRFMQIEGPNTIQLDDRTAVAKNFVKQLKEDDKVIEFFSNEKTISSQPGKKTKQRETQQRSKN